MIIVETLGTVILHMSPFLTNFISQESLIYLNLFELDLFHLHLKES